MLTHTIHDSVWISISSVQNQNVICTHTINRSKMIMIIYNRNKYAPDRIDWITLADISRSCSFASLSYQFAVSSVPVSFLFFSFYLFIIEFILKIEPLFINILICPSKSNWKLCDTFKCIHSTIKTRNAAYTHTHTCKLTTAPNTTHNTFNRKIQSTRWCCIISFSRSRSRSQLARIWLCDADAAFDLSLCQNKYI